MRERRLFYKKFVRTLQKTCVIREAGHNGEEGKDEPIEDNKRVGSPHLVKEVLQKEPRES